MQPALPIRGPMLSPHSPPLGPILIPPAVIASGARLADATRRCDSQCCCLLQSLDRQLHEAGAATCGHVNTATSAPRQPAWSPPFSHNESRRRKQGYWSSRPYCVRSPHYEKLSVMLIKHRTDAPEPKVGPNDVLVDVYCS